MLKDHKSSEAMLLSRESYQKVIKEATAKQGYELSAVKITEGEGYSIKPAQLILTNAIDVVTKDELLTASEQIKFSGLDVKLIDLSG